MRWTATTLCAVLSTCSFAQCVGAKSFVLKGEVERFGMPTVSGLDPSEAGFYREEIYGSEFSVQLDALPAGTYDLRLYEMEGYFHESGGRRFRITVNEQVLQQSLDIFDRVGYAKPFAVTTRVNHPGGRLVVKFTSVANNAKLNGIELRDLAGKLIACSAASELHEVGDLAAEKAPVVDGSVKFRNPKLSIQERAKDVVRRLSLAEKVAQLQNGAPAIPRLGIPAHNWWSEALHGSAFSGRATVFPEPIGLAATFSPSFVQSVFDVVSTEVRAKNNAAVKRGDFGIFKGLNVWTPNINLFRDPRWGRGQETYGEDPYLTGVMGVAVIKGLQGTDPKYKKLIACAKHYAVHSGPESKRHVFNTNPNERDLWESYLPHFEMAVKEGGVGSVMGAYNSIYGQPATANKLLINDVLRKRWGFKGFVVSDCGAINDIYAGHKFVATRAEASAIAVKTGTDLDCGDEYKSLISAVRQGYIKESEIDVAVERMFEARIKLGMFDPSDMVKYTQIPASENESAAHAKQSLEAARRSIVLLKNANNALPLNVAQIQKVLVVGPNANERGVLLGNYSGDPSRYVTILAGIKAAFPNATVVHASSPIALKPGEASPDVPSNVLEDARSADVTIFVGGINSNLEGEEMRVDYEGFSGGDRTKIELPAVQTEWLKQLNGAARKLVFVNMSGSAMAFPWAAEHVPAIVQAWYPGQEGGTAVADVLTGKFNPSGKLPVTFYASTSDLPDFEDYSMRNRTYRYFTGKPMYAFGHGLSYSTFTYGMPSQHVSKTGIDLMIPIANSSGRNGAEVVQVYARFINQRSMQRASKTLVGFAHVGVAAGGMTVAKIHIDNQRLRVWDVERHDYVVQPGTYALMIGSSSADIRSTVQVSVR